jgi:hypothetical protein
MTRIDVVLVGAMFSLVGLVACAEDGAAPNDSGPDATIDAATDSGGTGGSSGSGGAGGTGGTGGAPIVTCAGVMCEPVQATDFFALPACCTAQGTGESGHVLELMGRGPGQCGLLIGVSAGVPLCAQVNQPGVSDSSCPSFQGASGAMAGCCSDEGYCGVMETVLSLGCTYNPNTGRGGRCGNAFDAGVNDAGANDAGF